MLSNKSRNDLTNNKTFFVIWFFFHYQCLPAVVITPVLEITTKTRAATTIDGELFICLGFSLDHPVESAKQPQKVSVWPEATQLANGGEGIWTQAQWTPVPMRFPHHCAPLPLRSRSLVVRSHCLMWATGRVLAILSGRSQMSCSRGGLGERSLGKLCWSLDHWFSVWAEHQNLLGILLGSGRIEALLEFKHHEEEGYLSLL